MKNVFYLLLAVLLFSFTPKGFAQSKGGKIPPFRILLSNGTFYNATQLPIKPLLLIYFSPECDHCRELMDGFFKRANEFKETQVVMVTFVPVKEVYDFERKYQLMRYPNIKVGTEGNTFFLRMYYKLTSTPFAALYDKKGNLISSYRKEPSVDDMISQIKKIK